MWIPPKPEALDVAQKASPNRVRSALAELGTGAAWLLGLTAVLLLADGLLHQVPMARALLTALGTSIAVGRAGVVWDEDDPSGDDSRRSARLLVGGIARGLGAGAFALAIAAVAGWVTVDRGRPGLGALLAVAVAVATAVREELLFRALPFHFAKRAGIDDRPTVVFATLLSPTPFLLSSGTTAAAVALSLGFGFLSARLLVRTRSVWSSIGSNVAARIVLGPTLQTAALAFAWQKGEATLSPLASGAPAWIAAGLASVIGLLAVPRAFEAMKKETTPVAGRASGRRRSLRTRRR